MKFHKNPSSGGRVVPSGQTDGQTARYDEANSRFFAILRLRLKTYKVQYTVATLPLNSSFK
jgi:hypothetical protein